MLSSEEAGNVLGLTDGRHYGRNHGGHDVDGAVDLSGVIVAKVGDSACDGSRAIARQVGAVGLLVQAHLTRPEDEFIIGKFAIVGQETVGSSASLLCRMGLLAGQGRDSGVTGGVHSYTIVQECTADCLNFCFFGRRQRWTCVTSGSLRSSAKVGGHIDGWRVGVVHRAGEAGEGFCDVSGEGQTNEALDGIEAQGDAQVFGGVPFGGELIPQLQDVNEVLNGCFVPELDTEVINHECEGDAVVGMAEQAGGGSLMVAMLSQVANEFILRDFSCMW